MAVESTMRALGWVAAPFRLPVANPEIEGPVSITDFSDKSVLAVVFTCNHCPYAKHVVSELVRLANDYASSGVQLVAINSNDTERYTDDSFERMAEEAQRFAFPFPYLFDESQEVAKAYGAACTPDAFVFDNRRTLVYRGRIDETRPNSGTAHGGDIRAAIDAVLAGQAVSDQQFPSIGCSIKWKPGNAPA